MEYNRYEYDTSIRHVKLIQKCFTMINHVIIKFALCKVVRDIFSYL